MYLLQQSSQKYFVEITKRRNFLLQRITRIQNRQNHELLVTVQRKTWSSGKTARSSYFK